MIMNFALLTLTRRQEASYGQRYPSAFVRLSVRPSVRWSVIIESKSVKTRIYNAAVMIVCVCVSEHGVGEGMDGGCMPLPTHPQQFCDPASLVLFVLIRLNSGFDRTTETDGSDKKLCCNVNLESVPCILNWIEFQSPKIFALRLGKWSDFQDENISKKKKRKQPHRSLKKWRTRIW